VVTYVFDNGLEISVFAVRRGTVLKVRGRVSRPSDGSHGRINIFKRTRKNTGGISLAALF